MKPALLLLSIASFAPASLAGGPNPPPVCDTQSSAAAYAGKWQVNWTYRTAPDVYETSTAVSRISHHPVTCGLREQFSGKRDQAYFYDWTVTSLEAGDKEAVWLDSVHGGFLHYDGLEGDADWPARFVWRHENGRLQTRFQYSRVVDGTFTIERHLSSDSGATWALTSRGRYKPYKNYSRRVSYRQPALP